MSSRFLAVPTWGIIISREALRISIRNIQASYWHRKFTRDISWTRRDTSLQEKIQSKPAEFGLLECGRTPLEDLRACRTGVRTIPSTRRSCRTGVRTSKKCAKSGRGAFSFLASTAGCGARSLRDFPLEGVDLEQIQVRTRIEWAHLTPKTPTSVRGQRRWDHETDSLPSSLPSRRIYCCSAVV